VLIGASLGALLAGACGGGPATPGDIPADTTAQNAPLSDIVQVAAGETHTCAVNTVGRVFCWGSNTAGQLGNGSWGDAPEPRPLRVAQGTEAFSAVDPGGEHTCALTPGREIWCWGSDAVRQLGYMTSDPEEMCGAVTCFTFPRSVIAGTRFRTFATGYDYTCAGSSLGTLYCWGSNRMAQLGLGGISDVQQYAWPVTGQHLFDFVVAGDAHTCGVALDGVTYCWGDNASGQVGNTSDCSVGDACMSPTVIATGGPFVAMALGASHTCGLRADGTALCWGSGRDGALGTGDRTDRAEPTPVQTEIHFARLAAGGNHTCGLSLAGAAYCWGAGDRGQLGAKSAGSAGSAVPLPVSSTLTFSDIAAGAGHTCAVGTDGHVYCWGANDRGQLGDGSTSDRSAPAEVVGAQG